MENDNNVDEDALADAEWAARIASSPPVKKPTTRLLDMLAGWGRYQEEDGFPDSEAVRDRIHDIYQQAGQFCFDTPEADQEEKMRAFLQDTVLPTLMMKE